MPREKKKEKKRGKTIYQIRAWQRERDKAQRHDIEDEESYARERVKKTTDNDFAMLCFVRRI